ncbi:glycosyltransferase [Niabella sp. CC-SYL272]|uniref:glycosyltransferase n=1 Tax=Niabella agricola TaxID=2891571 RepID=UPI001F2750E7|nr:glycosyltransferase [Niabella agricola]MCF3109933.1 glycosyltransferase [Niabella agricola]
MAKKNVLFIVPYPVGMAPSQRFRVEQFFPLLRENAISYDICPFLDVNTWRLLYKNSSSIRKVWGILSGYVNRWLVFFRLHRYSLVFIHREAAPLGPPLFEWLIAKVWRKKMIYDFDDAIWIPNTSAENKPMNALKSFWKVPLICKYATIVFGGNDFLCEFAKESGARRVLYLPTVVDTEGRYGKTKSKKRDSGITIGWTGSHSTLKYLNLIVPVLKRLETEYEFRFVVIADKNPAIPLKNYMFIPWNVSTEIEDLEKMDIGLMPLTNDKWSEGKCGFKLIQYMALGIASVASPVGVNKIIITDGHDGFLCEDPDEWHTALKELILNADLRRSICENGRKRIEQKYSIISQKNVFIDALKS